MSKTLLVVRDVRASDDEFEREEIAETPGGLELLDAAADVWGLIDGERADAIRTITRRAASRWSAEVRFEREDCLDLAGLLHGVDAALIDTVVDSTWNLLPAVKVDADRQLPAVLSSRAGSDREAVVASGISITRGLANLFRKAVDQHAEVVLTS